MIPGPVERAVDRELDSVDQVVDFVEQVVEFASTHDFPLDDWQVAHLFAYFGAGAP